MQTQTGNDHAYAESVIRAMQAELTQFGLRFISDNATRRNYQAQIQQYVNELLDHMRRGEITPQEAARLANATRNDVMNALRLKTSDVGRAVAESFKPEGKTLSQLLQHYAQKVFQRPFEQLSKTQQDLVYLEIVKASARDNPKFTSRVAKLSKLGKGLVFVSVAISVYNVASAEDKVDALGREGATTGGGILGGAAGGALAGLACGPGAPVCVTIGVFVGGVAGALGADWAYGWFKD
ncbi:MAG TPA: hypothetical protein VK539_08875 [Myxococcaceae bacterium]|nr:hypothetical protein [Myxococcaceae bacterium]